MPQTGWIIFVAVAAAPVVLGLALHRLGFSRAVSLGLGVMIVGAALVMSREPLVDSSTESQPATISEAAPRAPSVAVATPARSPDTEQRSAAALDAEKAAHRQTELALKAATDKLEASEAAGRRLAAELQQLRAEPATSKDVEDARRRLVIAEATIARLEAAARAAPPRTAASPIPQAPAPFSASPPAPPAVPAAASTADIATGSTSATKAEAEQVSPLGRTLSEAARTRRFELAKVADGELVEGRAGSYYRITCPDGGGAGRRLTFEPGGYTLEGSGQALANCLEAVQQLILGALPPGTKPRLYVQGFASTSGFVKPKPLPPRDSRLKTINFLPRQGAKGRFATQVSRQSIRDRYGNAELPNLRAAYVADWIAKSTKGAVRPEILAGDLKPGRDASSRSFDLVFQATW